MLLRFDSETPRVIDCYGDSGVPRCLTQWSSIQIIGVFEIQQCVYTSFGFWCEAMALAFEQKVTKFLNLSLPRTTRGRMSQQLKCYSGSYRLF